MLFRSWGFDPELLFLAQRSSLKIVEVSVRWGHVLQGSRFKPLRHGSRMFADLLRVRWLAWTGRYAIPLERAGDRRPS